MLRTSPRRRVLLGAIVIAVVGAGLWLVRGPRTAIPGRDATPPPVAVARGDDVPVVAPARATPTLAPLPPSRDDSRAIAPEPSPPTLRAVPVRVVDESMNPLVGVTVAARPRDGVGAEVTAVTDATGTASLRVSWTGRVSVVARYGGGDASSAVVEVDVIAPARLAALQVHVTQSVLVWVRRGGSPYLPTRFVLRIDGHDVLPTDVDRRYACVTVRIPFRREAVSTVTFESDDGKKSSTAVPVLDGRVGLHAVIDLEAAGVGLDIEMRLGVDPIESGLRLQRFDPVAKEWKFDRFLDAVGGPLMNSTARRRIDGLARGRYRVWTEARTVSDPVDVVPGVPATLRVDATRTGFARGTVVGPDGETISATSVMWDGKEPKGSYFGSMSEKFAFPVPGDRAMTIGAFRAGWTVESTVTVVEPRDDVVVRMRPGGPRAEIRLADPDGVSLAEATFDVQTGLARASPTRRLRPLLVEPGVFAITGFDPGRNDVVIDDGRHASLRLRDVDLGVETTDLGSHRLQWGRAIRVRVVASDVRIPPLFASAAFENGEQRRTARWSSPSVGEISGLVAGRYRILVHGNGPLPPFRGNNQLVDVGDEDVEVVLDFRPVSVDRGR